MQSDISTDVHGRPPQLLKLAASGLCRPARLQTMKNWQQQAYVLSPEKNEEIPRHVLLAELKSCSIARNLEWGKSIHAWVLECGSGSSIHVATAVINMYAKCGSMADARRVFDSMRHPDAVSWTALLLGYVENGEGLVALDLFSKMKSQGCIPDSMTYVAALKACGSVALKQDASGKVECLEWGTQLHSELGCHLDLYLQNTLMDMYGKCGSMVDARRVFESMTHPDVVSWNTVMLGYADNGEGLVALDLFSRMKSQLCVPNCRTFVAALKACTSLAVKQGASGKAEFLERGKQIHLEIGYRLNLHVQSTLVDMYAKCGSMVDSRRAFESINHPNVVSWTALLLGYADHGEGLIVMELFSRMKSQSCSPNALTYMAVIKACGLLGSLEYGRKVHAEIAYFDAFLVTCLVDFYAKCGSLVEAQQVFDLHSKGRDVTTWTALLAGYSSFGDTSSVFRLFDRMQQDARFRPNAVTFQCILMCCNHAGLVAKARECFELMHARYGPSPSVEHYNIMLDVLGRANKLDDAMVLLQRMACSSDAVTWMTVLGACRKWRNVEMGRLAFQCLLSLDVSDAAAYVQIAHLYASSDVQEMVSLGAV